MNRWIELYAPIVGRILMGGFFLWNGIEAAINFSTTTSAFTLAHLPEPLYLAILAVTIEAIGGILLVVGSYIRPTALVLILFIITTTALLFNTSDEGQLVTFIQNMAIIGGLLCVASLNPEFRTK